MPFLNLIQGYFVPSSITCVNSMEVSYIPIAKARGFTTHWIKSRRTSTGSLPFMSVRSFPFMTGHTKNVFFHIFASKKPLSGLFIHIRTVTFYNKQTLFYENHTSKIRSP